MLDWAIAFMGSRALYANGTSCLPLVEETRSSATGRGEMEGCPRMEKELDYGEGKET